MNAIHKIHHELISAISLSLYSLKDVSVLLRAKLVYASMPIQPAGIPMPFGPVSSVGEMSHHGLSELIPRSRSVVAWSAEGNG
jgi:hypothetical protein